MGTVISNLKARFGVDTSDFKKGLKDGEQATAAFKGAAGGILDEFASMFGVNMSGVTSALGTANKSLSFLGASFKGAAASSKVASIAFGVFKFALAATGIGAIVVVLGTLISYFTKSGEGADNFAKILAQVKSVINNVVDRLAVFGKGVWEIMTGKFKQGWETMSGAFKGMGDEIKEDIKSSRALAAAEDALEEREIAHIKVLEEQRAKAAELRLLAKETIGDEKKKLSLLNEAEDLYKSIYGEQMGQEEDRFRLAKWRLNLQASDPTDKQRRAVAEQEAKISSLQREQAEQLKGLNREKKAALAAVTEELALEKAKAGQIAINKASISNLKMPDLSLTIKAIDTSKLIPMGPIIDALEKAQTATEIFKEYQASIKQEIQDINAVIESSLETVIGGFGEWVGAFAVGAASFKDARQLVGNVFGDMCISLGNIAIGVGIGIEAIKAAFKSLGGVGAVAAGVALIALGSAVKASLRAAAPGGGSGGSASPSGSSGGGGGSFTYDTRKTAAAQPSALQGTVRFEIEGTKLVGVLRNEEGRRNVAT